MGEPSDIQSRGSYGKCCRMALICGNYFRAGELRTGNAVEHGRLTEVCIPSYLDLALKSGLWMNDTVYSGSHRWNRFNSPRVRSVGEIQFSAKMARRFLQAVRPSTAS